MFHSTFHFTGLKRPKIIILRMEVITCNGTKRAFCVSHTESSDFMFIFLHKRQIRRVALAPGSLCFAFVRVGPLWRAVKSSSAQRTGGKTTVGVRGTSRVDDFCGRKSGRGALCLCCSPVSLFPADTVSVKSETLPDGQR